MAQIIKAGNVVIMSVGDKDIGDLTGINLVLLELMINIRRCINQDLFIY